MVITARWYQPHSTSALNFPSYTGSLVITNTLLLCAYTCERAEL